MIQIKHLSGNTYDLLNVELGDRWCISIDDCDEDLDILDVTLAPEVIMKVRPVTKDVIFELGWRRVMIDTSEFKEINII